MLFSSITFLYYFLPIVLVIYFAVPKGWKNYVLLISSLFFYFCGEPIYTWLLVFSSVSDYFHSLYIEKYRGTVKAKIALCSSIIINLGMLGYFKYTDFFIENINSVFGTALPLLKISLPIGISFFTFQTMSYTIDVYRGRVSAQRNFASLATFVCLFPQLVAGPIVRYTDVDKALTARTHSVSAVAYGIKRFALGLGKKVLIANVMGELCAAFFQSGEGDVLFYWMYAIAYTLQIYFDFSGYSDMAIGLGSMFGFSFPENFDYPFISKSISEFWRRWHMTLGGWFRDYLYIPLGGNRVSTIKWIRNIFIVWFLTGFWHGAQWNFIIWGLGFGVMLILEKFFIADFLKKLPSFVSHIYVMLIVIVSFIIFDARSMPQVMSVLKGMLGIGGVALAGQQSVYLLSSYGVTFIMAIVGATPLPKMLVNKLLKTGLGEKFGVILEPLFVGILLLVTTAYLVDGSFNPFLYFRF
ncbi:MAG: MBOAT family O-acyltransferase [Oscillospiraceae bacterium]